DRYARLGLAAFFACAAMCAHLPAHSEPAATPATSVVPNGAASGEEKWLAVTLNGQNAADAALVLGEQGGKIWVRGADLEQWRIMLPPVARSREHLGESFYPLDALAGIRYSV